MVKQVKKILRFKMITSMNELSIARAIHILSIVIWIGGVAFVTIVLIPILRSF